MYSRIAIGACSLLGLALLLFAAASAPAGSRPAGSATVVLTVYSDYV